MASLVPFPSTLPSVLGPGASAGTPTLSDVLQTQIPGYSASNPLILSPSPGAPLSSLLNFFRPQAAPAPTPPGTAPGAAPQSVSWWSQPSALSGSINNATMVGVGALAGVVLLMTLSGRRRR